MQDDSISIEYSLWRYDDTINCFLRHAPSATLNIKQWCRYQGQQLTQALMAEETHQTFEPHIINRKRAPSFYFHSPAHSTLTAPLNNHTACIFLEDEYLCTHKKFDQTHGDKAPES